MESGPLWVWSVYKRERKMPYILSAVISPFEVRLYSLAAFKDSVSVQEKVLLVCVQAENVFGSRLQLFL